MPELADDERWRCLCRPCALGTSRNPFELDELRRRPQRAAGGGAREAVDDDVDASEEVDVLDMVGTMMVWGYVESLLGVAKGILSF